MKITRTGKRREAAINSVKVLLTSATLAATFGGWALISAAGGAALQVAQAPANATAVVQDWLAQRSTTSSQTNSGTTSSQASTTAVAATATPVPTQVVVQPTIRTRSSR